MANHTHDDTGCSRHEPYALQVLGEAMEPEFPDRCVVIIAPGDARDPGSYVFAQVAGVRWFRKYVRDPQGGEYLIAENPRYPAIALAGLDWTVLGVIVQRNIRRRIKQYNRLPQTPSGPTPALTGLSGDQVGRRPRGPPGRTQPRDRPPARPDRPDRPVG